jgi:hypothetical protein
MWRAVSEDGVIEHLHPTSSEIERAKTPSMVRLARRTAKHTTEPSDVQERRARLLHAMLVAEKSECLESVRGALARA